MIARCVLTDEAAGELRSRAAIAAAEGGKSGELEFREVPYFLVSRSMKNWSEEKGDINIVRVLNATEAGLVIDPTSETAVSGGTQAPRHTLVPWTNIISITLDAQ